VYAAEHKVKESGRDDLLWDWRYLQTSDHFYYMCTKWFSDGDVHKYFNPYGSPYEAYINYMNILSDFIARLEGASGELIAIEKTPDIAKVARRTKPQKEKPTGKFQKLSDLKVLKKAELKRMLKEIDLLDLWYATYGQKKDLVEWIVTGMTTKEQAQFVSFSKEYAKPGKESIEFSRDFVLIKANTLFDQ
jgi:alpha-amylase/alpha-mannosidase (GH57 family)